MRWDSTHPTLEGRRSLIQAYVGGGTQFLTAAQGMPTYMLEKFQKLISNFFWGFQTNHTINDATTHLPQCQGGMNILDLEARNEAIYLVWAERYLAHPDVWPTWAFVADEIFKHTVNQQWKDRFKNEPRAMLNHYMQDWWPTANKLPLELKLMVRATTKHGVKLDGAHISEEVRGRMPIWYHPDRTRNGNEQHTSAVITCLRQVHEVFTVHDAVVCGHNDQQELRRRGNRRVHNRRTNCGCEYALDLTNAIGAKWSPYTAPPDLSGSLSAEESEENARAFAVHEPVTFDPTTKAPTEVHNAFRVFTNTLCIEADDDAPPEPGTHEHFNVDHDELTITACGKECPNEDYSP
ncbi:hypothetical protein AURDEDRAFT_178173 [Auricularia subglabra TFB-10046 SS5]|uniref:Uncharacterized protein n=1 Tax=Auricularia subglabra (strain TFB-10046 / SS5) TaxID=717982 RepID=J0D289_AURST|nr:hypothetical protein AURDEDRAFT_178173 [Auricularia subglabra TFB-10046 SS5]